MLKMAEKRAFVDAVLRATASSSLFTQDLEDMYADQQAERTARQGASAEAGAQAPQRAAQAATADDGPGSVCPKHNRTWKQNRRGWYCSSKDDSTDDGWCALKPSREWAAAQEVA